MTPRPPVRPLSIASCSWDTLVAELGDPLPAPVPAAGRPPVPATVPLRLRATGATASGRAAP